MDKKGINDLLREHPFFKNLAPDFIDLIAGCGKNVLFPKGDTLFKEGDDANVFYILRGGRLSLRMNAPGKPPMTIQTLSDGQIAGWSWLVPPHKWAFDGVATEELRAVSLDGACLRKKCSENHELGYELFSRVSGILAQRLQAARLQLLDIYGNQH